MAGGAFKGAAPVTLAARVGNAAEKVSISTRFWFVNCTRAILVGWVTLVSTRVSFPAGMARDVSLGGIAASL